MRFSTVAVMAGSALASEAVVAPSEAAVYVSKPALIPTGAVAPTSTDYTTHLVTITACPETVTDCPARSMTSSVLTSVIPLTTSTVYSTKTHTITSCEATITNCPASSIIVTTEVVPISTTVCPVTPMPSASTTARFTNSTVVVPTLSTSRGVSTSVPTRNPTTMVPRPSSSESECVTASVVAITKTYTTVLTSVEYSTLPCETALPTGTTSIPGTGTTAAPTTRQPSGTVPPTTTRTTVPTAGASSLAGSALLAAAAGVAALVVA